MKQFLSTALINSLFLLSNAQDCGFTPLCGTQSANFGLSPDVELEFEFQNVDLTTNTLGNGTIVEWEDCCLSKDTLPTQLCETLNPSGVHERTLSTIQPLCDSNVCEDSCHDSLVIKPVFIKSEENTCCSSCSCYGDPVCESFNDIKKTWILCDGREIDSTNPDKCVFTKGKCESQLDHAGNLCQFKEPNNGFWNSVQRGSPCVPNEESPRSLITMYNISIADLQIFALNVEQGERGTISNVYLTLSIGLFSLSALDCLTTEDAWQYHGSEDPSTFENLFKRTEILEGFNVGYSIKDPFTGVEMNIRCFSNHFDKKKAYRFDDFEPEGGVYVPRINVESVVDPFLEDRSNANGFCVTNLIDFGAASLGNTRFIEDNNLCQQGHDNQRRLDVIRAMCNNPATTLSHERECLNQFCQQHFLPLYDSPQDCLKLVTKERTLAEGFCRGVLFDESDVDECIDQWNELGGLVVVQQYLDSNRGCVKNDQIELFKAPNACQSGVVLQYEESEGEWVDFLFLSEEYCGEEEFVFNLCEHPYLGQSNLRFIQKNNDPTCDLQTSCAKIDGFYAFIGLVTNQEQENRRVLRGGN